MSNVNSKGFIPTVSVILLSAIFLMFMTVVTEANELIEFKEVPVATDVTCIRAGSITIPEGYETVNWTVAGDSYEPGTYSFGAGNYTVSAVEPFGITDKSWDLTIKKVNERAQGATSCYGQSAADAPTLPKTGTGDYVGQIVLGTVALLVIGFGLIRLRHYKVEG